MDRNYWQKQTADNPLFKDIAWSRPENKLHAGKLLIIGGNAMGFSAAAEAYTQSQKAGIGTARVLLPNSLQKTVGRVFAVGEYAPSTPSGGFSQRALSDFLDMAAWADGVLLAGDLGRNSETAALLEHFAEQYTGQLTYTKDAAEEIISAPGPLLVRPNTLLVLSFAQLQKLGVGSRFTRAFTSEMGLLQLVEALHEFTTRYKVTILSRYENTVIAASGGQVSTTVYESMPSVWRLKTATHAAVWWLQTPQKPFEAITASLVS